MKNKFHFEEHEQLQSICTAFINGSNEAYTRLYNLQYKKLFYLAISILKCRQDAEDVVQTFFTSIFENPQKLSQAEEVTHYLYRCVRNACLDYLRKKKSTPVELCEEQQMPEQPVFHDLVTYKETEQYIYNAVKGLHTEPRRIMTLRLQDFSPLEIAKLTKKSPNTIGAQLVIARKILRKELFFLKTD